MKKAFSGNARTLDDESKKLVKAAPKPKADPNIVSVKFEFQYNGAPKRVDTKFAISQKAVDLYIYLEEDVFLNPDGLEVVQSFPKMSIPRDETKTLGALKLRGQVLLQVRFKGTPELRHPL